MDKILKNYFAHPHIDLSYRKNIFKAAKVNPYYNFKDDFVFLPHFFDHLSAQNRCLILSHEAHHAADMHNIFFILLHYLNEIIANFNYYSGSFLGEDPQGEIYSPPIYQLPEDEWAYLNILTEGLPIFTRFARYVNYLNLDATDSMKQDSLIDKDDEELWQLQNDNLPSKSVYDYGFGLFYEINKRFNELALKTDLKLIDSQILLNNILGEDYYDDVMKSLCTIRLDDTIGTVINFITPPLYKDVIRKLRGLDEIGFLDIMSYEYSIQIQQKISSIIIFLRDLFQAYKDSLPILAEENNSTLEGLEGLDLYFIPILEYETRIQEAFLNTLLEKSPNDRTLLRYFIGKGINRFCENPPYFRSIDVNEILTDTECCVSNHEFLNKIIKLELDNYRSKQLILHLILSANRESYNLPFVDCPIRYIFEDIEKEKLSLFCEQFTSFSSKDKLFCNSGSCRYIKEVKSLDNSSCVFTLFTEMIVTGSEKRKKGIR